MKQKKATHWHFPDHLLLEILVRLPVKALLRFRSVSKSWNSLISTSNFITAHINHNDGNNNYCALLRCYYLNTRSDTYALHSDSENLDKIMDLDFPQETREFFYIVGCANGVVCLMDSYQRYNTVLLWNPSIRKFRTLPDAVYKLSTEDLIATTLGFGFDTLSNDYKFIRIYSDLNGGPKIDMFKLSTSCWTDVEISKSSFHPKMAPKGLAICFNNVLHWLSSDDHSFVGFDLGKENFTTMKFPKEVENTKPHNNISIEVWHGSLLAFAMQLGEQYSFWVMNEYGVRESWTKLFEIRGCGRLLSGITRKKGLMLFGTDDDEQYINAYDPETRSTTNDILHLEGPLICLQITPYIESLALLNEGENLPTLQPFGTHN